MAAATMRCRVSRALCSRARPASDRPLTGSRILSRVSLQKVWLNKGVGTFATTSAGPSFRRAIHLGLTVRDRDASADWYEQALGFQFVKEFEAGIPRILLLHPESGFLVGLYSHPGASGDGFSPVRTGLDHFALEVERRDDLDAWARHFDSLGVGHSPVRELGHSS